MITDSLYIWIFYIKTFLILVQKLHFWLQFLFYVLSDAALYHEIQPQAEFTRKTQSSAPSQL